MKAISIRQPWASLIVSGAKNVENRSWWTDYRGGVAVLASKARPDEADMARARELCAEYGYPFPDAFPVGCVVGVVAIAGIVAVDDGEVVTDCDHDLFEDDLRGWNRDVFGFVLENPRALAPIPASGRLGLFNLPPDLERKIRAALAKTTAP